MDPLHFAIAVGPLGTYFICLGLLHLRRRATIVGGGRDAAAVAIGLAGCVAAGPMELFMPESAATHFGPWVWLLLLSFYGLCVTLWILLARPRLVIYHLGMRDLLPVLKEVAPLVDSAAQWSGETLVMPQAGVQLHVEVQRAVRVVTLVALGDRQSYAGWARLHAAFAAALAARPVRPRILGTAMLAAGATLVAGAIYRLVDDPVTTAALLTDMLRL